jgi:uncharacterized membrane protein
VGSGTQLRMQAQRHQLHDKDSGITREDMRSVVSQQEIVLPDAEELAKYQALDPNIVTWLMTHAAKEQDFRHQSHNRKLTVREKNARSDRRLDGWGMLCGFIIFMGGMGLSGFMIHTDHSVAGSIFGGVTLIGGAALFVNRNNAEKPKAAAAVVVQDPPA